jgi:type I restriction enzyme S subunit
MTSVPTSRSVRELADTVSVTHRLNKRELIFLNTSDILNGRILHRNYTPVSGWPGQAKKSIKRGDILFSEIRPANGRYAFVDFEADDYVVSTKLMVIRAKPDEVIPRFLYHFLTSSRTTEWLQHLAESRSGTFPQITFDQVADLKLVVPSPDQQARIAGLFDLLDEKIEQNHRTAQALERLARTIFRAWLVDFEPVKAKAAGATSFSSMPQAVFDALPTRFVDSEIGPVPDGWTVKALASIATFLNGLALQKYPPRGDGNDLPVIKIAELRKGSTAGADLANGDVAEQYVIQDRDLLFSWSGTLEAEFWFGGKGALNQHLFKVTSSHFPSWFCLLWIRRHLPSFRQIASSKATTMGHIKREHLQEAKVAIPPLAVLEAVEAIIGPLFDLHAALQIESRKLAAMRDYLMPKLLSAEVRVAAQQVD